VHHRVLLQQLGVLALAHDAPVEAAAAAAAGAAHQHQPAEPAGSREEPAGPALAHVDGALRIQTRANRFVGIRTRVVSKLLEKILRVELPYRTADRSSEARSPG
jgi:hypothetical protein